MGQIKFRSARIGIRIWPSGGDAPPVGADTIGCGLGVTSMRLGRPHAMRYHDAQLNLPGELRDKAVGTSRVAPRFP